MKAEWMFLNFLQLKTHNRNLFLFLHFMPVDPSKGCTLGLRTCTKPRANEVRAIGQHPLFSASRLANDRACERETHRLWTFCRPHLWSPIWAASGTSQGAARFLSAGALLPVLRRQMLELSCARGPAPPHLPPTFGFNTRTLKTQPARTSSRFVSPHRVLFLCRLSVPGSSPPAASLLRISVPLLLHLPINRHPLVEWLHICSQPFTDPWISVFNKTTKKKILFFRKTVLTLACSD